MLPFTAGLFDWSMQHQSSEGPPPKQVTPEEQKWWVTPVIRFVKAAVLQRVMYAASRALKPAHDQHKELLNLCSECLKRVRSWFCHEQGPQALLHLYSLFLMTKRSHVQHVAQLSNLASS